MHPESCLTPKATDEGKIDTLSGKSILGDKWQYKELLLLADPEEQAVNKYLDDGEMFILSVDDLVVGEAVVKEIDSTTCELMNIAVLPEHQKHGYATQMLSHLASTFSGRYQKMLVGTAEPLIAFYERAGFHVDHVRANFFVDNYSEPVIENGVTYRDMTVLCRSL
ncbi:putative GNAT family N-acetyltransferase [Blattamonas nauphoetae]|uniref:GNAT family N-acetyltransferase n=1 Tax=Blattamonas nauphoetae TaxID=2049346 RepID=A0ABQ9X7C2_9EUKA|nr:putative GNAT family N-acetyltransferase [Blattamonas nauphoetae]